MTLSTRYSRRMAVPAAALAAFLLAGCSSGHVGESWQCPLADTGACDSVAAVDPAVPDAGAGRSVVLTEPRVRNTRPPNPRNEESCDTACDGGFDPFAWLARLFGVGEDDPGKAGRAPLASGSPASAAPALPAEPLPAEPGSAALPGAPDARELHAGAEESAGGGLRTDEAVARIWIAPFVDGDGVYREASHVRVVLEPAGWRLGR